MQKPVKEAIRPEIYSLIKILAEIEVERYFITLEIYNARKADAESSNIRKIQQR